MEKKFGLIGRFLSHSFSKAYFDEKFFREKLTDYKYDLYPMPVIEGLRELLTANPDLCGLNVTIPYKEEVIAFLDEIDPDAKKIGAINVIDIRNNRLKGYNTDSVAFLQTLQHWADQLKGQHALILGTGGSSKAVQTALEKMAIPFESVSRDPNRAKFTYELLKQDPTITAGRRLLINTTPLGMSPNTNLFPEIPYEQLTDQHLVYDLIYNPARTQFIQKAEMRGCSVKNGLEMLHIQAEKAWEIWNTGNS